MINIILAYCIIIFGVLSLIRMSLLLIGADIHAVQSQLALRKRPHRLRTISIIVPAHNEEAVIQRCLQSIERSTYPKHLTQVIVANDGSTDETKTIVQQFPDVILINGKRSGKAKALNNAIQNFSTGELIMCLDADSTITPNAIQNLIPYFLNKEVVAVASNVTIRDNGTLLALIQKVEYIIGHHTKRALTVFNTEYIIGGVGSTFRRSIIEQVGFYDTNTMTEDIDLTLKILKRGNKKTRIIYAPDVITETEPVHSVLGLLSQRYRWKYGRYQAFYKHSELFFQNSKEQGKLLTWLHLPAVLFGELMLFLEPILAIYFIIVVVKNHDTTTLLAATGVMITYVALNIISEETIRWKQKISLIVLSPLIYLAFYFISGIEYIALMRSILGFRKLPESIKEQHRGWSHVQRKNTQTT